MALVNGMGTTFNLPNYHGELFLVTPTTTPLLSMAGGIGGGKTTDNPSFEWQAEDLRAPASRPRLEGDDAPAPEARSRTNLENVLQIFHESVSTSYTKQGAFGQYTGAGTTEDPTEETGEDVAFSYTTNGGSPNPVTNEHAHQVRLTLTQIARDVNYVFWNGTYAKPNTNATERTTQGLIEAITNGINGSSNVVPAAAADLSFDLLGQLLQSVYENGGITEEETATLFVSPFQKRQLTQAYATANTDLYQGTRNVGGLNVQTIHTDFGTLNVVVERVLPAGTVAVVSMDQVDPVFMNIPGKGVLFEEELAKTGASEKTQIYGEIGLKFGNPLAHGLITGLSTS